MDMNGGSNAAEYVAIFIIIILLILIGLGLGYWYYYRVAVPSQLQLLPTNLEPATTNIVDDRFQNANISQSESTAWMCAPTIPTPIKLNKMGQLECLSTDGEKCMWVPSKSACEGTIKNLPNNIKPLKCTTYEYDDPSHWCYQGVNFIGCNTMKKQYGITSSSNMGTAPDTVKNIYKNNCVVFDDGQKAQCDSWKKLYTITDDSFGSAGPQIQKLWVEKCSNYTPAPAIDAPMTMNGEAVKKNTNNK